MAMDFGSTAAIHGYTMHILWGPLMNVLIILALYSYRRYAIILHAVLGLAIGVFSLTVSLAILNSSGFASSNQSLYFHYNIGFTGMICLIIQLLLGVVLKLINWLNFSSFSIMVISYSHRIFGYVTVVFCKMDYLRIYELRGKMNLFWGFLAFDIATVFIIIIWKLFFPKLEAYKADQIVGQVDCKAIDSLSTLQTQKDYVVFANYVYDMNQLKVFHPAGMQVIKSVKNTDLDRYLYGMFSAQEHPEVAPYSHTFRSLKLLGDPVAKIGIAQVFRGIISDSNVEVQSYSCLSRKTQIFQVKLKCLQGNTYFDGYRNETQLGRFRALILDNKITRLYTNVYFSLNCNIRIMQEIFHEDLAYHDNLIEHHRVTKDSQVPETVQNPEEEIRTSVRMTHIPQNVSMVFEESIPLIFKRYEFGKFTKPLADKLISGQPMSLTLSCERGIGLKLHETKPGKILMLVGGTCLLPFGDIIDLLFKQAYGQKNPEYKNRFLHISPILEKPFLKTSSFHLFAAFACLQDIHKVTLMQMMYLQKQSTSFKVTIKLGENLSEEAKNRLGFQFVKERFENLLPSELGQNSGLAKVWVCGSPKMNEKLIELLLGYIDKSQILVV